MKILVNTLVLEELKPCEDRYKNWLDHYGGWSGDITEFLKLENITYTDKMWAALRLAPRFVVEVFAIDCALSATRRAAAHAADAATDAAYCASAYYAAHSVAAEVADTASYAERTMQLEILSWLIETYDASEFEPDGGACD